MATDLKEKGYSMLGARLTPAQIADIHAFFAAKPCFPSTGYHRISGTGLKSGPIDEIRKTSHFACYEFLDILEAPHLLELANSPDVLEEMRNYLGREPVIYALRFWWSFPQPKRSNITQNFHRDPKGGTSVLFAYLTDVDRNSGAHSFVEGSHDNGTFSGMLDRALLGNIKLRDDLIEATHFEDGYMINFKQVLPQIIPRLIKTFDGPAGTTFLEDVYGLHMGDLPVSAPRLIFSARYAEGENPQYKANGWWPQKFDGWRARLADTPQMRATNRLIIEF